MDELIAIFSERGGLANLADMPARAVLPLARRRRPDRDGKRLDGRIVAWRGW